MSSPLAFRAFEKGDEAAVLGLFETVFGTPLDPALWRWRFARNEAEPVLAELAWDGDSLVGHYAVSPVIMRDGWRDRTTALSLSTMTHPGYRGRGVFPALAKRLYARLEAEGFDAVWGFPNHRSHRVFIGELGWSDIGEIGMLSLDGGPQKGAGTRDPHIERITSVGVEFDRLLESCRGDALRIRKDAGHVRWRFAECPREYELLGYFAADRLIGFAAWKMFGVAADLCDVLSVDPGTSAALVRDVSMRAFGAGAKHLDAWCALADPLYPALERMGFVHGAPVTYLAARLFRPGPSDEGFFDLRRWRFSMGDSDVY